MLLPCRDEDPWVLPLCLAVLFHGEEKLFPIPCYFTIMTQEGIELNRIVVSVTS